MVVRCGSFIYSPSGLESPVIGAGNKNNCCDMSRSHFTISQPQMHSRTVKMNSSPRSLQFVTVYEEPLKVL